MLLLVKVNDVVFVFFFIVFIKLGKVFIKVIVIVEIVGEEWMVG